VKRPISGLRTKGWKNSSSDEVKALRDQVRKLSPETITVACETINCRDLADGIADILADVPGWKVTKLHRGGLDITGVTGIRIEPQLKTFKRRSSPRPN
jgi:hypothetical protein